MLKKISSPLFLIVLIALSFRLVGLKHGFPFIFHPDEPAIVRGALALRFDKNPGHFDWPHLYLYLNYFIYMGFAKVRDIVVHYDLKEVVATTSPLFWNDTLVFYFITRLFTALLGGLTVIPIYLSAKTLFDEKVGVFSALVFAVFPFHINHSHYALGDVPVVFLMSWVLFFSTKIMVDSRVRNYILAGLFTGLAASVKYNGGLIALVVPLAHLYRVITVREEKIFTFDPLMNLLFSGVCSVVGFIIGTPFSVFDFKTFIRTDGPKGALWQFTNVGEKSDIPRFIRFVENVFTKVPDDIGYTPFVIFIGLFILLILNIITNTRKKDDQKLWFLIIPSWLLLYYVGGFSKTRSHYLMVVYPFIAIITGYVLELISKKIKSHYLGIISVLLVLSPLVYLSSKTTYAFAREDTRVLLVNWIQSNSLSSNTFLYNTKELGMVMEDTVVDKHYGYEYLSQNPGVKGVYVVVSHKEELPNEVFERYTYLSKMKLDHKISSDYRRGPNISIYKSVE